MIAPFVSVLPDNNNDEIEIPNQFALTIQSAALNLADSKLGNNAHVQLWMKTVDVYDNEVDVLLATLSKSVPQAQIGNMVAEETSLFIVPEENVSVHVVGQYHPFPNFDEDEEDEDEDDEGEEDDEEDDDEDELGLDEDQFDVIMQKLIENRGGKEPEDDEEISESEISQVLDQLGYGDEDEDDDDEEEEEMQPKAKKQRKGKASLPILQAQEDSEDESEDEIPNLVAKVGRGTPGKKNTPAKKNNTPAKRNNTPAKKNNTPAKKNNTPAKRNNTPRPNGSGKKKRRSLA